MFELNKTDEVKKLISITKSDSGEKSGYKLGNSLERLGFMLGEAIVSEFDAKKTAVIPVMEGGFKFGYGLMGGIGDCKLIPCYPESGFRDDSIIDKIKDNIDTYIIADDVINGGDTMRDVISIVKSKIGEDKNIKIACCVINEDSVPDFDEYLYVVRVSKNKYKGGNTTVCCNGIGPDTKMRCFNQLTK